MESFGVAQIIQNANLQRKYRPPPHRRHFLYSNFSLKVVDIWNGMVYNTKAIEGRAVLFHKRVFAHSSAEDRCWEAQREKSCGVRLL